MAKMSHGIGSKRLPNLNAILYRSFEIVNVTYTQVSKQLMWPIFLLLINNDIMRVEQWFRIIHSFLMKRSVRSVNVCNEYISNEKRFVEGALNNCVKWLLYGAECSKASQSRTLIEWNQNIIVNLLKQVFARIISAINQYDEAYLRFRTWHVCRLNAAAGLYGTGHL